MQANPSGLEPTSIWEPIFQPKAARLKHEHRIELRYFVCAGMTKIIEKLID
jgi:hypothetical protein